MSRRAASKNNESQSFSSEKQIWFLQMVKLTWMYLYVFIVSNSEFPASPPPPPQAAGNLQ